MLQTPILGKRMLAKYYSPLPDIKKFEKGLWEKTKGALAAEILLYEGMVVVYKQAVDLSVYIIG